MAARDVLFVGAVLFILGLGFFFMRFTSDTIVTKLSATPLNESQQAIDALQDADTAVSKVDYIFLGVFIAFILGMIITSWFIAGNPIFVFFYFIIVTIGVVVSAILSNTWEAVTTATIFGSTLADLPIANHILLYLPYYLTVFGFIGMIVMFAKPRITGDESFGV